MSKISRLVLGYAVAVPLALILGFLVATPDMASFAVLGFVLFCLAIPLVIQWHHTCLIVVWNSAFMLAFLPGEPRLWLVLAGLSFGLAVLNNVIGLQTFLRVPELTRPLLCLLGVVLVTAWFRGGLGSKVLGGSGYGGRNYIYIFGAYMGYFALTAQRIVIGKSQRMVKWFFLSATTNVLPNLAYILGPAFYGLYNVVSVNSAMSQAQSDWDQNAVARFGDFGPAAAGLLSFMLARWGIRRTFEWDKPWRLLLLTAVMAGGLLSGYRNQLAFLIVLFAIQFILEGLWKTAFLPLFCVLALLCLAPMIMFANKMPSAVQRSLAFLPVNINPDVRADAEGSLEWRFQIWRIVWPEVPKYLLLGKGYSLDPLDLDMTTLAARSGLIGNYEEALYAGDYHNGPLSVLIPFGLFGGLAFLWLLAAGAKVLYSNYRHGDARLRQVNMTLLASYLTQCLFFFVFFGALNSQLMVFLGTLGFSVCLNGGVCRKLALPKQRAAEPALDSSLAVA
jgi:hypothetical protein